MLNYFSFGSLDQNLEVSYYIYGVTILVFDAIGMVPRKYGDKTLVVLCLEHLAIYFLTAETQTNDDRESNPAPYDPKPITVIIDLLKTNI